jgi:hypothetical protein
MMILTLARGEAGAMKPQDLFIGIRDVLALLVPGAVLILLLPIDATRQIADEIRIGPKGEIDTALLLLSFLVVSLATGSLLSALAGQMDKFVDGQTEKELGDVRFMIGRASLERSIGRMKTLRALASALKDRKLQESRIVDGLSDAPWTPRAFWWNYLRLNCPEAIAELDRVEGFQKQFRSLTVVFSILSLAALTFPLDWGGLLAEPGTAPFLSSFGNLLAIQPWLAFLGFGFAACLCFVSYAAYRVIFSIRLFELALIAELSSDSH